MATKTYLVVLSVLHLSLARKMLRRMPGKLVILEASDRDVRLTVLHTQAFLHQALGS